MRPIAPGPLLRNAHVQSLLASSRLRRLALRLRHGSLDAASREHVLDCGAGVRLQGFLAPAAGAGPPRGLAVLLHGWEGSHRSTYLLAAALQLRRSGYQVFRLNLRDHGDSHHLNEELFHSCRLDEVVGAVGAIARAVPTRPLFLVGFSLGGNFALRVGLHAPAAGLPVRRIVAVCPVVSPQRTLTAMEDGAAIYQRYFVLKWRHSLRRKQRLFPQRYDFSEWMRLGDLRRQTDHLVRRYAGFPDLETYLDGYSIAGSRLSTLAVPATIVTAEDDPIIPVTDFHRLELAPETRLEIQQRGGHCGFLETVFMRSWINRRIAEVLDASVTAGPQTTKG